MSPDLLAVTCVGIDGDPDPAFKRLCMPCRSCRMWLRFALINGNAFYSTYKRPPSHKLSGIVRQELPATKLMDPGTVSQAGAYSNEESCDLVAKQSLTTLRAITPLSPFRFPSSPPRQRGSYYYN
ncbi:hypothetical protein BC936DRAFT_143323 [Jimgerdemannia flammicorona]|uniref:Uncharacterized protein n=1 Tax=Jimgerdemannia flammicorona TaxID=994334 RepID=A0A433DDZ7_9FUNG|nr:hypothetical protein BC936DRAFT_143323 [Jimgerdemannia flammicorona]